MGNFLSKSKEWSDWLECFETDTAKKAFENIKDSDTYSVLLNLGDEVLKEFIHIGLYEKLAIMLSKSLKVSEDLDCKSYDDICEPCLSSKVYCLMNLEYRIKQKYIESGQYHLFLRRAQEQDKKDLQALGIDISSI